MHPTTDRLVPSPPSAPAWNPLLCALLSATLCLPALAQSAAPQRIDVRGIVINASTGDPLPRALVKLEGDVALAALTDGEGRFEIPGVESGLQTFDIEKPGFRGKVELGDYTVPASHTVRVGPGLPELRFTLAPENVLTGHVTLSTGDPGVGIGLTLLRQTVVQGHATWAVQSSHQSTPDGSFRFPNLPDGVYLLRTAPASDNQRLAAPDCSPSAPPAIQGFPAVYYGGSSDASAATRIALSGGQTSNAEIALAPVVFHAVQAAPAHALPGAGWQFSAQLLDGNGSAVDYPIRENEQTHAFCAYLPDGTYMVALSANSEAAATQSSTQASSGVLAFSVEGRPLPALSIPLSSAAGAVVHVRYEPGPPQPPSANTDAPPADAGPVSLELAPSGRIGQSAITELDNSGSPAFPGLTPGAYWLQASQVLPNTCIGPATAGNQPLGRVPLVIGAAGSAADIDLVLRTDCASLTLQLADSPLDNAPGEAPSAFVSVVPGFDFVGSIFEAPIDSTGDNRSVTIPSLTPGVYRVVVSREPRSIEWRNPAVLDRLTGQEIVLEPNGHATVTVEAPRP